MAARADEYDAAAAAVADAVLFADDDDGNRAAPNSAWMCFTSSPAEMNHMECVSTVEYPAKLRFGLCAPQQQISELFSTSLIQFPLISINPLPSLWKLRIFVFSEFDDFLAGAQSPQCKMQSNVEQLGV